MGAVRLRVYLVLLVVVVVCGLDTQVCSEVEWSWDGEDTNPHLVMVVVRMGTLGLVVGKADRNRKGLPSFRFREPGVCTLDEVLAKPDIMTTLVISTSTRRLSPPLGHNILEPVYLPLLIL